MSEAVIDAGGTITHHHAVGRDHRPWYDRQRPDPFAEALRAAKRRSTRRRSSIQASWSTPNLSGMETLTEQRPAAAPAEPRPPRRSTPIALLAAMRPSEWIKNLLVFAGLLFSQKLKQGPQVVDATLTFAALLRDLERRLPVQRSA